MQKLSTKNKWLILTPLLVLPFLGLIALVVAAGSGQVIAPPVSAKAHEVEVTRLIEQESYQQQRIAYGRVESGQRIDAGFELAGTINSVLVDEGQSFEKGQLLAKLDTQRLHARMQELNAALARAEADYRLAKLSEKRVRELVAKQLESTQRQDETREATLSAEALVAEINARKASLQVDLDKSILLAPFAGSVRISQIDPGTVVAAGQSVLTLQQNAALEARIALPEDDAAGLLIDGQYNLLKGTNKLTVRLKSIATQRSLDTRTVDVRFELEDGVKAVMPGDLVAYSYTKSIQEQGIWIPKQALSSGVRGLWTLFIVEGEGNQHILSKSVEVLHVEGQQAFVRGALKQGDLLITNGVQRLVPDQVVTASVVSSTDVAKAQ
jgi:RND family efflux transporter MFP subunit